jgi:small nuclear ribonucleoprotein (snRNP)-like protein
MENSHLRPFDTLDSFKGKKIIVQVAGGTFIGVLLAFDLTNNLVIDDCEVHNDNRFKLGITYIKGDNIIAISPFETHKRIE